MRHLVSILGAFALAREGAAARLGPAAMPEADLTGYARMRDDGSGHMMYVRDPARVVLRRDLEEFHR